ncbi:MAG TPA: TRAP transporter small permease subunit [Verrucomicrobiae bacterium]|nr:TRAP transporter small permease subunit [Verrucomicrobiae bacterium]
MPALLKLSDWIDALTERIGRAASWLILASVLISAGNALVRYLFNWSSNAWLEIQWYLFSAAFLLCAGYALKHQQHVRVDVVATRFSPRVQAGIEIFGTVFFLLPMALLILWHSWPVFIDSWNSGEVSANANGLVLWPARLLLPAGFALLVLQGVSELIKRVAFLQSRKDAA